MQANKIYLTPLYKAYRKAPAPLRKKLLEALKVVAGGGNKGDILDGVVWEHTYLSGAFFWDSSPQGYEFWCELYAELWGYR